MATTWGGWQAQMLTASPGLVTPPNITFMTQWHDHAPGTCQFNPVDLSTAVTGSARCGDTVAGFGRTQSYGTHAQAVRAFRIQMDSAQSRPIKAALNTGNPFQIPDRTAAVKAIRDWGSPQFADWYASATTSGGTGSGTGGIAPDTTGGWNSLRRSLNRNWRRGLSDGERNLHAALRALSHSRKVRR